MRYEILRYEILSWNQFCHNKDPMAAETKRRGLQVVISLSVLAALIMLSRGPPSTQRPATLETDGRWRRCQRVLRLSQVRLPWEPAGDRRCSQRRWSPEALAVALRRRAARRGRRARLVFVGDSRLRVLQQSVRDHLGLRWQPGRGLEVLSFAAPRGANLTAAAIPEDCVDAAVDTDTAHLIFRCSVTDEGGGLRVEAWRRPRLDAGFARQLDALLAECAAGDCADLVVLNAGMWYAAWRRGLPKGEPSAWAARFAAELAALRPRLARLAARTPTVWKVDEPYMAEVTRGARSGVSGTLAALTAALFEQAARVPGLTVWTSAVPEAVRFYHTVCRDRRRESTELVRRECQDPVHVGDTMRWSHVQALFNLLLQGEVPRAGPDCCLAGS